MNTMFNPSYPRKFAEAAQAVSVTCRHLPVVDGTRLDSASTLAERCVR